MWSWLRGGRWAAKPGVVAEAMYRREMLPWALLGITMGLVEGATAAVLLKQGYAGAASPLAVNVATALVSGAPAVANVVSFAWANIAHGRSRIRLLVWLQALFALSVGGIAFVPRAAGGLVFAVATVLIARVLWAGIITIRAVVWTANYPRQVLARITGRIVVVSSLTVAATAFVVGQAIESPMLDAQWLYAGAGMCGLAAALLYRRSRVRREFQLLADEHAAGATSEPFSLGMLREILARDPDYRQYMFWMGLFGSGNLMLTSQLVVILSDVLDVPGGTQILLLAVVPLVTLPAFIPVWARMFDGSHVIVYRSRQAWALVAAVASLTLAVLVEWSPLLWLGAMLYGAAMAGAHLGWNLGHNDFAAPGRAQHYMGVHVTLTGVRGMFAPVLGILVYQAFEAMHAGWGRYSMFAPLALTVAGAVGFNRMRRQHARAALLRAGA